MRSSRAIATNIAGIRISEILPRHARVADKFAIIRSCSHETPAHEGGKKRVLTGHVSRPGDEDPMEGMDACKTWAFERMEFMNHAGRTLPILTGGDADRRASLGISGQTHLGSALEPRPTFALVRSDAQQPRARSTIKITMGIGIPSAQRRMPVRIFPLSFSRNAMIRTPFHGETSRR